MRGDVDFEKLVQEHYGSLYRFALSLTRNESDACDLSQQTFYLWAAKGHQLEDRSKVKSWLFTTLYREFLAGQRHRNRFPHHELAEVEVELPEVPPELPTHLDWEILEQCLAQMPPAFQAPVCLFYLEDYSYDEIAHILDIPLGTVKSRISRGVAQLQKLLSLRIVARPRIPRTDT
ncbi:MAG: RNA polymerase sigma factor [Verrucomicrobia bacterium]|nr:RNA polymerase sigma factor [Verrucomicrobiota bacterium]